MDTKPLEFIQAIIARLSGNSFQMKAWNVALATAAVGLAAAKDGNPRPVIYAIVPAFALWLLDAYYLALEKRYRDLYQLSISQTTQSYSLNIDPPDTLLFLASLFRPAVALLHLPMLAVVWLVAMNPIRSA